MDKFIKTASAFALCAVMAVSSIVCVGAAEAETTTPEAPTVSAAAIKPGAEVQGDNIVWKTRIFEGRLQKRRWNDTKKCWVDPYWIDCG